MRVNVNHRGAGKATLSVVVPCRDDREEAALLVQSLQESKDLLEILIVEPGSAERNPEEESCFPVFCPPRTDAGPVLRHLRAPLGRARQMNAGARAAQGTVLLFLHADSRVDDAGIRELCRAVEAPDSPAVAFRLRYREPGVALRLLEWGGWLLAATVGIAFGDQGLGLRRDAFFASDMFPDVPILEDWFLNRRLRRTTGLRFLGSECETSARRFLRHGVWTQLWQNTRILYRGVKGADLSELAREYERGPGGGKP